MKLQAFAAVAAILLLCGCSAQKGSLDRIQNSGEVSIAITSQEDKTLTAVAEAISQRLDAQVRYVPADDDQALKLLSTGAVDVAVGYFNADETQGLDYSQTFAFDSENVYAVCSPEHEPFTLAEELDGMPLGADQRLPSDLSEDIGDMSSEKQLYCTDVEKAAEMLEIGDITAYFCYFDEAQLLAQQGYKVYSVYDIEPQRFCALTMRNDKELFAEVNAAVGEYLTEVN